MGERHEPLAASVKAAMTATPLDSKIDVHIRIRWHEAGNVTLGSGGKLQFPRLPIVPGLYEFRFTGSPTAVYVGESDNLNRRMAHYRNPGSSQRTNLRINDLIGTHLATSTVTMAIATAVTASWNSTTAQPLDLTSKAARVLGESIWVLHRRGHGYPIKNAAEL